MIFLKTLFLSILINLLFIPTILAAERDCEEIQYETDSEKKYTELKIAAYSGDAVAEYSYGCILRTFVPEKFVREDVYKTLSGSEINQQRFKSALIWFKKAAQKNIPMAQYYVGISYFNQEKSRQDYSTGIHYLEKAIENKNSYALHRLGEMYLTGTGVEKNQLRGLELIIDAGLKGNIHAQARLGEIYEKGNITRRDYKKAIAWYKRAASQKHKFRHSNKSLWLPQQKLGKIYYKGEFGEKKNLKEALKWYRLASKNGSRFSSAVLSKIYYLGLGTNKDIISANMFAYLGFYHNSPVTLKEIISIENEMTKEQIKKARILRKTWRNTRF